MQVNRGHGNLYPVPTWYLTDAIFLFFLFFWKIECSRRRLIGLSRNVGLWGGHATFSRVRVLFLSPPRHCFFISVATLAGHSHGHCRKRQQPREGEEYVSNGELLYPHLLCEPPVLVLASHCSNNWVGKQCNKGRGVVATSSPMSVSLSLHNFLLIGLDWTEFIPLNLHNITKELRSGLFSPKKEAEFEKHMIVYDCLSRSSQYIGRVFSHN